MVIKWLKERKHNKFTVCPSWSPGWRAERQLSNPHCEYLLLHFKSYCEEPFEQVWDQAQIAIPNPAVCAPV